MKKQLLLLVMIFLPIVALAEKVKIDGLYYELDSYTQTAKVSRNNPGTYYDRTIISIPSSISYNGVNYKVAGIGAWTFDNAVNLTSITIPEGVTYIEENAFYNCCSLPSITIPSTLQTIGSNAFIQCNGLTSVHISDLEAWCKIVFNNRDSNPLVCAHHLFLNGEEIKDLVIPSSMNYVNYYTFDSCTGLTSVTIPSSVTFICNFAFFACSGITSVTIPNSVTIIRESAFSRCSSLTSLVIPNSVTEIGSFAFSECSALTSLVLPNNLTTIGYCSFSACSSLPTVTIPNSVTTIGKDAFNGCNELTTLTIGSGIKTIYGSAFASCPLLKDVFCYAENVPKTENTVFDYTYIRYYGTLHVPTASVNSYRESDPWKSFKEIVAISEEAQKCLKPSISYINGKLKFHSETEGATCQYSITDSDIKSGNSNEVDLSVTYNISVYATKSGYDNSDAATATLCWIESDPKTEGVTNGVVQIPARAVLIQSESGILKVEGIDDGTHVSVFTPDGKQAGSTVCRNGAALIGTSIQPGNTAIVKIGNKTVKIIIK